MREEGFELAQGYGALKERTFRIGNMGYIKDGDIELMLKVLSLALERSASAAYSSTTTATSISISNSVLGHPILKWAVTTPGLFAMKTICE